MDAIVPQAHETARTPAGHTVTMIAGDGVGPEIMHTVRRLVGTVAPSVAWEECEAGAAVFAKGIASGVPTETLDSIARTGAVLKGPLETPVGHGGKSANVTLRKLFETYGNIRPVRELPGVATPYSGRGIDMVVVRENVEDLYAGIEHMQTPNVAQCLKLISRKGCEKIIRLAFELAVAEGRASVHCATKANIMKLTEGMMKRVFEEIATDYPGIQAEHIIVDNCAHRMVTTPEMFDVVVTTNMNGDILSDLAAGLVGGLGLAPSANVGDGAAIFEAVHGSAPDIAGKNLANPTAMLLAAAMLLRRIGLADAGRRLEKALALTLEQGAVRTGDIAAAGTPAATTGTFADAVAAMLDTLPADSTPASPAAPAPAPAASTAPAPAAPAERATVGADLFVEATTDAATLGASVEAIAADLPLKLKMISNRGTQVYPLSDSRPDTVDHWRCRFVARNGGAVDDAAILALVQAVGAVMPWMHVEKLQTFDGTPGYTLAQGEA